MKKTILRVVALTLIAVMACAMFVACGGPASNPDKAKAALEKNGYEVVSGEIGGVTSVVGTKVDGEEIEYIAISYYEDKDAAKTAYEAAEKTLDAAKTLYGEDIVLKQSGKMVYMGTEQAIKDAK